MNYFKTITKKNTSEKFLLAWLGAFVWLFVHFNLFSSHVLDF